MSSSKAATSNIPGSASDQLPLTSVPPLTNTGIHHSVLHCQTTSRAEEQPQDSTSISQAIANRSCGISRNKIRLSGALFSLLVRHAWQKRSIHILRSDIKLCLFLAALDFTIATTAIPTIVSSFHSGRSYVWIGSAYQLASAASTPIWGRLSDIWGRKTILLLAIFIFAIGSIICAAATMMGMMLTGRSIQGAAAGGIVILVNICISDLFTERERGFYLGLTGVVWGLASGIGPLAGGAFSEYVSWRWNWWINLPCCGVSFVVLFFCLDRVRERRAGISSGLRQIDWLGTLAIAGLTTMSLVGLNIGGVYSSWKSAKVICLLVFGGFTAAAFIVYEAKVISEEKALIPRRILRRLSNNASLFVCFMHGFVNISSWYFLPLYFQSSRSLTPLQSGLLLMPMTVIQAATGFIAGFIIRRTGRYLPLIYLGMTLTTLAFSLFTLLSDKSTIPAIIGLELLGGLGVGLVFQPPLLALQSFVHHDDIATATAFFGFIRSFATSVSIVIGGVMFQNQMQSRQEMLQRLLPENVAGDFSGQRAAANVALIQSLSRGEAQIVKEAYSQSLSRMWILYACFAAAGLLMSFGIQNQTLRNELANETSSSTATQSRAGDKKTDV
ncbi:hypothetical protein GB937_006720 [Aspergillus fischeri]|nr:hypothetical protein GB937_006720 [Aspergillus fischeri]